MRDPETTRDEIYGLLTEHASDLLSLNDSKGRRVWASQSVEDLFGPEGSLFESAHSEDLASCQRWWQQILAGSVGRLRWQARDAAGSWRWLETSAALVSYGDRPHVLSSSRDVTDQQRSEEALRARERKLTYAESLARIGYWERDLVADRLTMSPEVAELVGLPPGAVLSDAEFEAMLHPDDLEIHRRAVADGLSGSRPYEALYRLVRPDGEVLFLHVRDEVIRDEAGRPIRMFGSVQDVTRRRRAEEELLRTTTLLRAVVEGTTDAVFVKDREGRYLLCNEAAAGFMGWAVSEILGKDDTALFDPASARVVREHDRRVMESGAANTEEEVLTAAGATRTYLATKAPYRDERGSVIGIIGISRDISKQKQLENQFLQAQKMEAIGRLAAGVAHDFNNLLTIICGYAEILLPLLPSSDPKVEMVSQIRNAGERAASLTRQLLAFSRQTVMEPRLVNLNELVLENDKMLRRLIGEDVHLTTSFEPAPVLVRVDPGQISQVVMNLAVNARDAMPTGGNLTIRTSLATLDEAAPAFGVEAKPGRYALLAVTDTGIGMTPEVRARVFEPFFTTKGPGQGTGLGLATVYGIVSQSGGFVSVYSEPGRGTTFRLYFPAAEGESSESRHEAEPLSRGTETVLLVEDEDAVRSLVQRVLEQAGYEVLAASRGSEALRRASEHAGPIHLLITDVVMPEMSGRELVERLAPLRPEMKALYLSGYTDDTAVRHGVVQADVAFLPKPFTMAALTAKVREVLDTEA